MRAGEVDDDVVVGPRERRSLVVPETEEEHVSAARRRVVVREKYRQGAVQPRVEALWRLARVRVGAERQYLDRGMPEQPVERLLPRVARSSQNRRRRHLRIMHYRADYAKAC